ncbi:tryptophan halogenase family protein [Novosphingobium mangrovi (ex Hu et al. 2023)]|uniref:Tryptophan 7-halogenase n=1 Tax=Novosphingobium mangrovi (ex Hu et al. 2023) TaxID=2930094 RepID=A0ABT0ADK5_9SPHN|nr:tryptophan halogenase family protein [Novosphingobium mangrovi (ex Hu et al. 2023)]MCJ1961256.1 tryptophan 7-halogenase [Novosphingobium mangrovi (ex Hu et al. 2023)]
MAGPEPQPVHFVIAGGGSAGWISAAVLARFLPPPAARITLVESEDIGIIGVGEATVPLIGELNRFLGIHEPDFVAATNGTFKLGIEFADWGEIGNRHFHGFGDYGADIAGLPVHQHWLRLAREGQVPALGDFSMAEVLASQDRFVPHEALSGEAAQFRHAFHFDAALYAAYLRRLAEGMGVKRIEGRIEHVTRDGRSGHVRALQLDGDRRIEGDVFLDCTGFASLLLGQTQGVGFEDWSQWLPCDRAAAVPCARAGRFTPFTRSTAKEAGWQWRIPLRNRTGNGHVYSSAHISDDEAVAQLLDGLDGEALAEPRLLRFTPGRRSRFWEGNVIAIGLAAGFLEPLESTAIQLIQTGVTRLVEFLPGKVPDPALAAEYNRQTALEYERIRDFIIAHYCRTRRTEPLWRQVAAMDLPGTLRAKLDAWDASGRVPMYDLESHQEPSWVAILLGQGVLPRAVNPRTQLLPERDLHALLDQRRTTLARAAERLPDHATFIARTCAAKPAPAT